MRVLIADDVPSILMLTTSMVRRRGHEAFSVTDGIAALDAVRDSAFDLVILDIQMPGMEGTDCAREIRRLPATRQPRLLIALTGASDTENIQKILASGFDGILIKPVTGPQLEAVLERLA